MAFKSRLRTTLVASAVSGIGFAAAGFAALAPAHAQRAEAWPSQVRAVYRIHFNGFDIGTFEYGAQISGRSYTATGEARLSALLGALSWRGSTRTSGTLVGDHPRPAGYSFDFTGMGKTGAIKMGFAGEAVTNVANVPPYNPTPDTVALRTPHLKGVLDPLSAVMAMSRSPGANPCARRIAVFDGRQRFDLVLSFKNQQNVADARPTGQPGVAFVCRVRYVPIAGHKQNAETRQLAEATGIEISLRPVPSADLYVPHQITIPTAAGPATLTAERVQILTPRNEQIALGD